MCPFAVHLDFKAVDVGVKRAAARGEGADRQLRSVMHAEDCRDVLQRAGGDQRFGPAEALFRRLEQQPHAAG